MRTDEPEVARPAGLFPPDDLFAQLFLLPTRPSAAQPPAHSDASPSSPQMNFTSGEGDMQNSNRGDSCKAGRMPIAGCVQRVDYDRSVDNSMGQGAANKGRTKDTFH